MANESIKAAFQRFWEHTINQISDRVEKEEGKGLSTNDFTDEYKNKIDYTTEKIDIQPDWNQNDETALDYVKNRTHWSEVGVVEVFPETEVEVDANLSARMTDSIKLEVGKTYTVTFNGTAYECVAWSTNFGSICLGSGIIDGYGYIGQDVSGANNDKKGEPFCCENSSGGYVYIYVSTSGTYTIEISQYGESVHVIDEKFLPGNALIGRMGTYLTAEVFNDYTNNKASAAYSHAEGRDTIASGIASHAEGDRTTASGDYSHAEGYHTFAFGIGSHAEGDGAIAFSDYQHVQGKYNIADTENKYAHIVGNGEYSDDDSLNSNAHTLDWNGNAWFAGNVYIGGSGQNDIDNPLLQQLATRPIILIHGIEPEDWEVFEDGISCVVNFAEYWENMPTVIKFDTDYEQLITISPYQTDSALFYNHGIKCTDVYSDNQLLFSATSVPTERIEFSVVVQDLTTSFLIL